MGESGMTRREGPPQGQNEEAAARGSGVLSWWGPSWSHEEGTWELPTFSHLSLVGGCRGDTDSLFTPTSEPRKLSGGRSRCSKREEGVHLGTTRPRVRWLLERPME